MAPAALHSPLSPYLPMRRAQTPLVPTPAVPSLRYLGELTEDGLDGNVLALRA